MFLVRISFCILLLSHCSVSLAQDRVKDLAQNPQWLALLHYASASFRSDRSLVDDSKFFLADDGNLDPHAELIATINLLYNSKAKSSEYCRFQARALWLNKVYKPISSNIVCDEYKDWIKAVHSSEVSLVFPASFINNPASAFGHTFIKLGGPNSKNTAIYSVNFAAATHGENAILYALKGIVGGYGGYFSIGPYYERLKKYNDLENRDMWEFGLKFTQAEIDLMLAHVWEMKEIRSDYYYFDENCSYHLLALLDVARPSLNLLKDFKSWVIPLDTVKVILSKPDLAGENRYRPASGTLLSARAKSLDSKQVSLVKQVVIQQDLSLLNAENYTEQALLLDSSDEYAAYLALKAKLNESQLREFQYQLLLQRSQLNATYHNPLTEIPKSPIESHASMKVAVTGGYAADSSFGELQLRPAYHSLSDKQIGFPQGSQILFMDTKLRFDKSNNFDLEKFTALDIVSAFPRNAFIKTTAWEFMTGIENQNIGLGSSRNEKLVWDSYFGLGSAVGGQTWLLAGFMDLRSKYNPDFDNSYALGLAPHLRALVNLSSELTIETEYFHSEYLAGDEHTASRADLRLRWFPEANHSIDIYGSRVSEYEDFYTELGLSVSKYF